LATGFKSGMWYCRVDQLGDLPKQDYMTLYAHAPPRLSTNV
jgi:hypothetical protein